MKRGWKYVLLTAYALFMFWLLFGKRLMDPGEVNWQLKPLFTLRIYWQALWHTDDPLLRWQSFANLFGNVVLFIPMGFFPAWLWEPWRKFWRQFLLMAGLIVAVEVLQIATGLGWCDIDDLLLNLVGTSLGFLLWKVCFAKRRKTSKS